MPEINIIPPSNLIVIQSAPINDILRTYSLLNLPSILPPQKNQFDGQIQSYARDKSTLPLSPLGTPVMQDITFKAVEYIDFITGYHRFTKDLIFQTVLLTVSQAKKIITTEIQGMNGTVKEYIGMDDYAITVNGIITGTNGQNPTNEIIELKNMLKANVAIPVMCTYLNNLEIFNIVVKDFTLDQEPGGYSKQNFSINCMSDVDVILQIL